jgi:LemA protein
MVTGLIIVGVVIIIVLFVVGLYNGLIRLKNSVDEGWAQIDVQLKRRADLIPNLIETVKGYAAHERTVLEDVTKARTQLMAAGTPAQAADADNALTGALKSLFAVSENYPQLRAVESFTQLQEELASTENKVAFARQYYNTSVRDLNIKTETFPSNIVAGMAHITKREYFEVTSTQEREAPKVQF